MRFRIGNCFRLSEADTWEFTELHYRCNRILVDMFDASEPVVRPLSLPKRHIVFKKISRHISPRPQDVANDRRRLQKLPVCLYNSAPESEVIDELKEKVQLMLQLHYYYHHLHYRFWFILS